MKGSLPVPKTARERMQAYRDRKKMKLAAAKVQPKVPTEAERQASRLQRLLIDHPVCRRSSMSKCLGGI